MITALAEAIGYGNHHDAVTGTSKQHVAYDYILRMDRYGTSHFYFLLLACHHPTRTVIVIVTAVTATTVIGWTDTYLLLLLACCYEWNDCNCNYIPTLTLTLTLILVSPYIYLLSQSFDQCRTTSCIFAPSHRHYQSYYTYIYNYNHVYIAFYCFRPSYSTLRFTLADMS